MSEAMTINDIINQLGSLRASSAEFAKSDPENALLHLIRALVEELSKYKS